MANEGKTYWIKFAEDARYPTKIVATAIPGIRLKPCPFCGSDNVSFCPDEEQFSDDTTTGFIWCHGCDFSSDSYYSEEIAAAKWNRRVEEKMRESHWFNLRYVDGVEKGNCYMCGEEAESTYKHGIEKYYRYCPSCAAIMNGRPEYAAD